MLTFEQQLFYWTHMLDEAYGDEAYRDDLNLYNHINNNIIVKNMSFPNDEINQLIKQKKIVTHRILDDIDRYEIGNMVFIPQFNTNICYIVTHKTILSSIDESPYRNFLTAFQYKLLSQYNKIALIELNKTSYERPYTFDQIKLKYPIKIFQKLFNDNIHKWRATTGIELIHKEPTEDELDRIWQNWQLMSNDMKQMSDKKSIELFGINNAKHYIQLKNKY